MEKKHWLLLIIYIVILLGATILGGRTGFGAGLCLCGLISYLILPYIFPEDFN
ncbi:MAG: hypothetical protein SPI35_05985 [Porphyromonas sp.]|nr:hypothetical protein [Porphyromonas sp.]